MNFYGWNIGDYASATRHLSWDEDLAYRRMLDSYYQREAPLPAEKRAIYRLVAASEDRHRQAVDTILDEFFELREDGWHNARADEEIAKVADKKQKAKASADARWSRSHSVRIANASPEECERIETPCEGNAPNPNPNPNPNNSRVGVREPRETFAELEHKLRDAAGWQNEPAPMLAVTGHIQGLINEGADLDLDVLPVVTALAPQAYSRKSWNFFIDAIKRARDQRLSASTPTTLDTTPSAGPHAHVSQRPHRTSSGQELRDAFAAVKQHLGKTGEGA